MERSGGNAVTQKVSWEIGRMQLLGLKAFC